MISIADRIAFRPLTLGDRPLVHAWVNLPHVRRWWDGLPTSGFVVQVDGRDAGWIGWERVGDSPAFQRAYRIDDPDTVGCDLFLGEPDVVHRGLGAAIVRTFLHRVVSSERWTTCVVDPEPDNAIAIRAYEKAGFRFLRAVPDDSEGHAAHLMEIDRAELSEEPRREEVFVRPARDGEIGIARAIDDDACTLYADAGMPIVASGAFFERETERWARSLREGRLLFACNADGEPVAFASFGKLDGLPFLFQLSTRRAWMQRGIGRRLVERVQRWAVRNGSLLLTTYDHLSFNRPFYERMGFTRVDENEWGPELRALVADETGALPSPDHRIVMRYVLPWMEPPSLALYGLTMTRLDSARVDDVQALCVRSADYFSAVTGHAPGLTAGLQLLDATRVPVTRAQRILWGVFTPRGALIGVLDVLRDHPNSGTWTIGLLLLDPEWRRRGVGRHVVERLLPWMRDRGAHAARLGVLTGSDAQRFWEAVGFTIESGLELQIDEGPPRSFAVLRRVLEAGP